MKRKTTILKLALICVVITFTAKVSAQSITTMAQFTTANPEMASLTQVICPGKKVQLSVPTTAGITYRWETRFASADGSGAGTGLSVADGEEWNETAALPAGYYTYKLKATNITTGCSEIYDQLVFVLPTPTLDVTAPNDLAACNNISETFNFNSAVTDNTAAGFTFPVSYQWYTKASTGLETAVATAGTSPTLALTSPTTQDSYDVYLKIDYILKSCDEVISDKTTIDITSGPIKPIITIAGN